MSASKPENGARPGKQNDGEPRSGLKPFIEAWGVVVLLIFLLALGVTIPAYLIKNQPAAPDTETVSTDRKSPPGVPVMPGAVLTRQTTSGPTSIYRYTVAQGSLASVQAYYRKALEQKDWVRQPRSNSTEAEYIATDKKLVITLSYQASHVQIVMKYTIKR